MARRRMAHSSHCVWPLGVGVMLCGWLLSMEMAGSNCSAFARCGITGRCIRLPSAPAERRHHATMKVSELHAAFLRELSALLPGWKFVASQRYFKRKNGPVQWLLHVAFVNHARDFDAVGNVAIEFLANRKRVAIIGAQLGNIAGIGQTRHSVCSSAMAAEAARSLVLEFNQVGLPFLQRYSVPEAAAAVLQAGGARSPAHQPVGAEPSRPSAGAERPRRGA